MENGEATGKKGGRGWLIALLVLLGLIALGGGLFAAGLLDRPLEQLGLKKPATYTDDAGTEYTDHGREETEKWLTGKRFAPAGACSSGWIEFARNGALRSAGGQSGEWELTHYKELIMSDGSSGRSKTFDMLILPGRLRLTSSAGDSRDLVDCDLEM